MSLSGNLDPALSGANGQWLWTPRGVTGAGDNSKGHWAVQCNLNQNIDGTDVPVKSTWVNTTGAPIKIVRAVSNIGTDFHQQILSTPGGPAYQSGEGAPICQYLGAILLQELSPVGDHLMLLSHSPSVFNQYQDLPWDKEVIFAPGNEPIIQPNDGIEFLIANFWPYPPASWNCQFDFSVYFKF